MRGREINNDSQFFGLSINWVDARVIYLLRWESKRRNRWKEEQS